MKAFITKYALTKGIITTEIDAAVNNDMIFVKIPGHAYAAPGHAYATSLRGNDWHSTPEAAVKRAEEMRVNEIDKLERKIAKLRKKAFYVSQ
jgi:hypothetical protein